MARTLSEDHVADIALTSSPVFLATRVGAIGASAANAALAPLGLRVRSFSVLTMACSSTSLTQRAIADFLVLDPSQVVSLIDSLESDGLVQRTPDPNDRRARFITATDAGRTLCDRATMAVEQAEQTIFAGFTEAERDTLRDLLRRASL